MNIDKYRLKVSERRKMYHTNTNQKKVGAAILSSDKTDLKVMKVIRDKGEHYIMTKGSVLQKT